MTVLFSKFQIPISDEVYEEFVRLREERGRTDNPVWFSDLVDAISNVGASKREDGDSNL